jgi:curved DNA-binding protein CbpA
MRDYYAVLQVAPEASEAEIKAAFRNLAKTCHPDVRPGDRTAEAEFQEARRAYLLLANPEKRALYDAHLADRRKAERRRFRRSLVTMSTTFVLTAASVLLATAILHMGGVAFGGGNLLAWVPGAMPQ